MKKSIKTKLEKLVSVLNDLKIDVSAVLCANHKQQYETPDREWAQFLKKPHILRWSVQELSYEAVYPTYFETDKKYPEECFYYHLEASVDEEVYIIYSIQCDEEKDCELNYDDGNNAISDLATKLFDLDGTYTPESLSKKLDEYIEIYSK